MLESDKFVTKNEKSESNNLKNCAKYVKSCKEQSNLKDDEIKNGNYFGDDLDLEDFNEIAKRQLWNVSENRIYLNLKKNEVLAFHVQDDKLYNNFLSNYKKYCISNDGFDLYLVLGVFLKRIADPTNFFDFWNKPNNHKENLTIQNLKKLASLPFVILFYLICFIS